MDPPPKPQSALFEVFLRLRPPPASNQLYPSLTTPERFLTVEDHDDDASPTHITLNPPNDNRRRAVEKFAFTRVFEEESTQLDLFHGTGLLPMVEGVLGPHGGEGRDGLLATLGVTGSGKSHTILGSRSQRGLTQLALDVLFRSISTNISDIDDTPSLLEIIAASDASEAQVMSSHQFLDTFYHDPSASMRTSARAPTPTVRPPSACSPIHPTSRSLYPSMSAMQVASGSPKSVRFVQPEDDSSFFTAVEEQPAVPFLSNFVPSFMQSTATRSRKNVAKLPTKTDSFQSSTSRRTKPQRPSNFPQTPDLGHVEAMADQSAEYAILISMYEVYNDRIFDLLTPATAGKSSKDSKRRPLLFKPTEQSPDRKVVAGLRKIICGTVKEALMVLEAGLHERRVAGTGSNSVSSRSHGFFCVEVKKRRRARMPLPWGGSTLTIVDLAGSERARDAKTAGATLAEAGKINESLMYLGQCLQMQSDMGASSSNKANYPHSQLGSGLTWQKPNLVPYRQCKLTELLFSNSFPSSSSSQSLHARRNPQQAAMIVTADPIGDFNATSQILRYSALAREVTVPRIPSLTSQIMSTSPTQERFPRNITGDERATMENAALQIAMYIEEIEGLRGALEEEDGRRREAEAHLESMVDRVEEVEMSVREECWAEMEAVLEREVGRWKVVWQEEMERNGEHLDRKVEILTRGLGCDGDENDENKENEGIDEEKQELERENERLRRELDVLRRELGQRSPTKSPAKRLPLRIVKSSKTRAAEGNGVATGKDVDRRRVGDNEGLDEMERAVQKLSFDVSEDVVQSSMRSSPIKKVRKLTAKKWELGDEEDF